MAGAILVTGGSGQLGHALLSRTWPEGIELVAPDRNVLDLRDPQSISRIVEEGNRGQPWTAVINAGAYTAVDQAEDQPIEAWQINAVAPAALGLACKQAGIPLIHISTDYVFSGMPDSVDGWGADSRTAPLGVYGASKRAGELAVQASGARHVIVRTSWVVSAQGRNFVKTMLALANVHPTVRVVCDQTGTPTSAVDLAEAIHTIICRMLADNTIAGEIVHFANYGRTTWADFAIEIFRQAALRGAASATVQPITTAEYPTRAQRPTNSVLSTDSIRAKFSIDARPWQDALQPILDELIGLPL